MAGVARDLMQMRQEDNSRPIRQDGCGARSRGGGRGRLKVSCSVLLGGGDGRGALGTPVVGKSTILPPSVRAVVTSHAASDTPCARSIERAGWDQHAGASAVILTEPQWSQYRAQPSTARTDGQPPHRPVHRCCEGQRDERMREIQRTRPGCSTRSRTDVTRKRPIGDSRPSQHRPACWTTTPCVARGYSAEQYRLGSRMNHSGRVRREQDPSHPPSARARALPVVDVRRF